MSPPWASGPFPLNRRVVLRPAPVNVNTAGVEELKTLNGIGDVLAQAIVDEREHNGPFSSVEDLTRVSGIGEKTLAKFADKVCI